MSKVVILGNVAETMINFRSDLINCLVREHGCEVYCFAYDYSEETSEVIRRMGAVPMKSRINAKGLNPFGDVAGLVRLVKDLKEIAPDAVFCTFVKPVIFGALAARMAGVKRIVGMIEGLGTVFANDKVGGTLGQKVTKNIQIALYKVALPKLDKLLLLNSDDKKDLIDKFSIKVRDVEIFGGIGLKLSKFAYSPAPEDKMSFLFVGRMLKEKGVLEFIEAAKSLKKIRPDVEFCLVGGIDPGNPWALSREGLNQLVDDGVLKWPGHVTNVEDWLKSCSVFVLPSYREGYPRSTQEAMATGRAVITTDVPGCRDTVIDGDTGFVVPARSSDALLAAMMKFVEDPALVNRMGFRAWEVASEKFDSDKINKRLAKIILQ